MSTIGELVEVECEDVVEVIDRCYELGWTDGLPVVPPTTDRVQEFLNFGRRLADEVVGVLPERRREITVGKIASSAVMAGCRPDYFPVVLAVAEAMLDPAFNLVGPSSSLGGAGILVMINGPVVQNLGINCRTNLFGPGNRANATIGRAVRLILMNACAATPGLFDRTILGHPGKFSYCIAENETETHWTPLSVERGYSANDSTVTIFACEGPRQVRGVGTPENMLYAVADVISSLGSSMATSGSVGDASAIIRQGQVALVFAGTSELWDNWSKDDVRHYLFPRLRRSIADLKRAGVIEGSVKTFDENQFLPLVPSLEDILIIFAGGSENSYFAVIPSWGPKISSAAVTRVIRDPKA